MNPQQLLLAAICFYAVVLSVVTYVTRAPRCRFLGALAGGLAVAVVGVGIEYLMQRLGFWHYPSDNTGRGPLLIYPAVVLMWAVLALIGWRVERRFGGRGQAVFLAVVAVVGTLRDYLSVEQAFGLVVLAPGPTTFLVDMACWGGTTALAQVVMRVVAGRAQGSRMVRRSGEPTER